MTETKAITLRDEARALARRDSIDLYFRDIRKIPVLSREEEQRLAKIWFEERDPDAGKKLVLSNLRFVVKVAREYAKYGYRLGDLVQEGNLGLLHAVDKFDPRKGFRLISYAVWWIRAYIQAYVLRSWSMVRLGSSRAQRRIVHGLQKARRMIAAHNSGEPAATKDLAEALEVSENDLTEAMNRMSARDVSLDQPVRSDGDLLLRDTLIDESPSVEENLMASDLQSKVREVLDDTYDDLTARERFLLDHRLLSDNPITLEAAGKNFGVTRERVRQLEERLKGKLKKVLAPAVGENVAAS